MLSNSDIIIQYRRNGDSRVQIPTFLPKLHKIVKSLELPSRERRKIVGFVGENSVQGVSDLELFKDGAEAVV